jgi:predicted permease
MRVTSRLAAMWRNVIHRSRTERDLDSELRATFELLVEEKTRSGLNAAEARRAAAIELRVESVKEQVREVRTGGFMDTLLQDVRYAARLLGRRPLFTLTAALSLAVGIGANATVFTIADGLLLRFSPAAVAEPDRLVDMGRSLGGPTFGFNPASYPDYLDIRRRTTTLDDVYAHPLFPKSMSLISQAGSEPVVADIVTTNYFSALGARAAMGRMFGPGDSDQPEASPIVVLSHRFWTRRFNGDPSIVGQTVRINRYPMTVVGVAQEGFQGTTVVAVDLWVPMSMYTSLSAATPAQFAARNAGWVVMGARLKPGVSVAQAAADLDAIDRALREEYPDPRNTRGLRLQSASPVAGNRFGVAAFIVLLAAIVSTVLAIACANVAGMLLARASERRREMALRLAIGAGRSRLIRQLLTETLMMFALGAAAAVVLSWAMTSALVSLLPTLPIPVQISLALDWRVVLFTSGLSLVAATLSGLAPALHASRADVSTVLKAESQGVSSRLRIRHAFVVAQIALSLLLVVVGGLFTRTLQQAGSADTGFDPKGIEVASLDFSVAGYTNDTGRTFAGDVIDRVRRLPGVQAASMAHDLPLASEGLGFGLSLPGATPPPGQALSGVGAGGNIVTPGYFATMRIPLLAGRDFTDRDTAGAPLVAVIGEAGARRFWPGQNPIGQQLVLNGGLDSAGALVQIVGVARDLQYRSLEFGRVPFLYLPLRQHYMPEMTLVVRSADSQRVAPQVRALVSTMNSDLPVLSAQPIEEVIAASLAPQRIAAFVAGTFGVVGVLLAAMGVYGVTAYSVARRTREIAIRTALGAQHASIVGLVLKQAIWLTTTGSVIGLALAAVAGQVLSLLLVGVSPIDPLTFIAAVIGCTVVTLTACYVPVHRAMRIEASEALRYE